MLLALMAGKKRRAVVGDCAGGDEARDGLRLIETSLGGERG